MANVLDVGFLDMEGNQQTLRELGGQNTTRWLVVNVASKCGLTRHYANLQEVSLLDDVTVVGFPCNQFGEQEKGSESEIKGFCEAKYSISFPMFSKVDVNGDNASPVFEFLKKQAKGFLGTESVKWNFSKFLVSRDGKTVKRYGSLDAPEILSNDIEALL